MTNNLEFLENYNYDFVDKESIPEELLCSFCKYPIKEATFIPSKCDHLYCFLCIDSLINTSNDSKLKIKCYEANCMYYFNSKTKNLIKKLKIIDKMIGEFKVYCKYSSKGCPWEGLRSEVIFHVKKCIFSNNIFSKKLSADSKLLDNINYKDK